MIGAKKLTKYVLVLGVIFIAVPYRYLFKTRDAENSLYAGKSFVQEHNLSGVTGTIFSGAKTRRFEGPWIFQGTQKPSKVRRGDRDDATRHRKWAVCTTIHAPTQAILDFVDSEEWAIVVVGDKSMAPFRVDGPNTFVLGVPEQEQLAREFPEFLTLLPWKHFGRKNIGYLFAILQRAEQIWDFDDDNFLKDGVWPAFPAESQGVHIAITQKGDDEEDECTAFNPLPWMGGASVPTPMWPRGFPLNLVRQSCNHSLAPADTTSSVGVLQSLADHEPDVDGLYRLTRITPMEFDSNPTPTTIIVSHGLLSPYNAQATLVARPAFWSLLLPVSVHGRVSDIWRSYVGQRLLWDIGMHVAFTAPLVNQYRNPHNPLADMKAEGDLYFKSLELVRFLQAWKGTAPTLPGRYEELVISLYEREYVEESDVHLAQQWLSALQQAGYEFPTLVENGGYTVNHSHLHASKIRCPSKTRVFVTGINGMIGSHVARVLVDKECYSVYGLVRPRSNLDTLVGVLEKIKLLTGDITDGPRMLSILEEVRPHYIYHFAAQAINGISYDVPELTLDTNVIGTMNILEAVRRTGLGAFCRILIAGSSTEYGKTADVMNGAPIPETAPLDPVSPYGVSKLTAEKMGNQYFMSFGVQVITARFFIQVGVGGTDSLAIHQFCKQIAMAEVGLIEPVVRHGNLGTARDMTDCRDSARIVVELAEKGQPGEAYNVGSGKALTIQELLDIAIAQSKVPIQTRVESTRLRAYDEKVLLADTAKIRNLTGWNPSTNMAETVASILDYWRRRVAMLYGEIQGIGI